MIAKIDMDNGSFPIAKDVLRVLAKTTLSSSHRGIIDAILDKTYGWYDPNSDKEEPIKKRKMSEYIKYGFFSEYTGLSLPKISRAIRDLVDKNIIKRSRERPYKYSFNCKVFDWDRRVFRKQFRDGGWGQLPNQVITQSGNKKLPNQATKNSPKSSVVNDVQESKETIYKETKYVPKEYSELSYLLAESIKGNDPAFRVTASTLLAWEDDVRHLVEIDNRPLAEVRELIIWSQKHRFWRAHILTMRKLREKYTQLKLQKESDCGIKKERVDPYIQTLREADKENLKSKEIG